MNNLACALLIAGYLGLLYFSIATLNAISEKVEEKHPRLIDKRWKRVIWLLSCFPLASLLVMVETPSFIIEEVRWFLSMGKKADKGE